MAAARVTWQGQQPAPLVVDLPRVVPQPPSRRRAFGVVGVVCACVAGLSTILFAPRTSPDAIANTGFTVADARQSTNIVSFVPGEPTVIVFGSSWSDSEFVLRHVDLLVGRPTGSRAEIQPIALMVKDSPTRARATVDAASVTYRVGLDAGGQLAERYGVTRLPAVVTLDGQGLVVGRQQGIDDQSQVTNLVDQLAQRTSRTTNGSN